VVYATPRALGARGLLDRRGLIHAHSVYSHDACDYKPVVDGVRDPVCFEDFRRGLCQSKHDFVMLSDHNDAFSATEFPDALVYRPDRADELVTRDGDPVASWAACPDGSRALVLAGTESNTMPVGLERHVSTDPTVRAAVYGDASASSIMQMKASGAVALVAHTENWTVDQLTTLPLDGFEMYNLHANTLLRGGNALELAVRLEQGDKALPDPNLFLLNLFTEDPRYITTWGTVLASGAKRVTTMGTDCHRNTFSQLAQDGERIDSYRRLMIWFSNHLLVRPNADGTWDDRNLKDALKQGRLYGAFEVFGYPVGFDFHAESTAGTSEIGDQASLASGARLVVRMPRIQDLDPSKPEPTLKIRILRAIPDGWDEVASGPHDLEFQPALAGAYRAEVRIVPRHLTDKLGDYAHTLLSGDFPWIYANAIYFTD
jgi:hypothetical protein